MSSSTEDIVAQVAAARSSHAREMMARNGIDHLLLGTPDNIRYVSDVRTLLIHESADWCLAVFDDQGETDVFAPWVRDVAERPYPALPAVRSLRPVPGWVPIMAEPAYLVATIASTLKAGGARTVGYDAVHPELIPALRQELPGVEFRYIGQDLFVLRSVKMPGEIALMEEAHRDNLAALDQAWGVAAPGVSDYEVLAEAMAAQQRGGAELVTHFTCAVRADFAVWYPTGRRIQQGDAIFIDQVYYGRGGYASDLTRTAFIGEPHPDVLAAYGRLIEARHVVEQAARPGARVGDLDALLNRELERMGLSASPYALGHGIGLRVCEPPAMTAQEMLGGDLRLELGQTIALEPETVYDHDGTPVTLKIEDCFVVEEDGLRGLGPLASVEGSVLA